MVLFGENSSSPQPVTLEITISKCPGVIGTDYASFCSLVSDNGHFNSLTAVTAPTMSEAQAASLGLCWAIDPTQYYVNARWTYDTCGGSNPVCGFSLQYQGGAW